MKKYNYLLKNIGLLTLSSFASKILSFLLVPLYTSILTTKQYGIYDMFNTTVMLLLPLITIDIVDAVLRFGLDRSKSKEEVFAIGNSYIVKSIVLLLVLLSINYFLNIFTIVTKYTLPFFLLYVFTAYSQLLQYFARGIEKVASLAVSGVISSIVSLSLNVLFLVYFKWGLMGYFYATIIGLAAPTIYLFFDMKLWRYPLKCNNKGLLLEMKNYSLPLVLNSISWWMNNSSSRYIVIYFCGIAQNGIFSVGYKIPTILNVFQSIFNQAWTLSSVKEFDPEDKDGFFIKIYNLYNFSMIVICSMLILTTKILAKILYANDFYVAWRYVPFLMIAIVFSAISGLLGGVFSAVKDSKAYSISTTIGAVANVAISLVSVYYFGAIGAAFGNALSFGIVWAIRLKKIKEYMNLRINLVRDLLVYGVLFIQSILILINMNGIQQYITQGLCLICIILLYRKEVVKNIKGDI